MAPAPPTRSDGIHIDDSHHTPGGSAGRPAAMPARRSRPVPAPAPRRCVAEAPASATSPGRADAASPPSARHAAGQQRHHQHQRGDARSIASPAPVTACRRASSRLGRADCKRARAAPAGAASRQPAAKRNRNRARLTGMSGRPARHRPRPLAAAPGPGTPAHLGCGHHARGRSGCVDLPAGLVGRMIRPSPPWPAPPVDRPCTGRPTPGA